MKNKKHYWQIVAIACFLPIIFALLDLAGAAMWQSIGGWNGDAYAVAQRSYQNLFWLFAYLVIAGIAVTYLFVTKDKSESIALFLIPVILLQMGAEDVFFYFMGAHDLWNATLPWLTNVLWGPTYISKLFGYPDVTGPMLLLSAMLGYALSYALAKKLVEVKG